MGSAPWNSTGLPTFRMPFCKPFNSSPDCPEKHEDRAADYAALHNADALLMALEEGARSDRN